MLEIRSHLKGVAWKPKFKAFGVHFSFSLLIILILLYFIFFHWYPAPFFTTDGGTQGLRLILFVDLVLGPTLTFIVFNRNKPKLKLDLTLIALTQVAALAYGVWTVHHERPVAIVFADDTFHPIPTYEFLDSGQKIYNLKKFGDRLPVTVYVKLPPKTDLKAREKLFRKSFFQNIPLFMMGDLYQEVDKDNREEIISHAIDMESYLKQDYLKGKQQQFQQIYDRFMAGRPKPGSDYLFFSVYARYCKCILVADRATLKFLDVLDIPPPQITKTMYHVNKTKP